MPDISICIKYMSLADNPNDFMISAPSDFAFFLSFFTNKADNNFGIKAIDFAFAFGYNLCKCKQCSTALFKLI